MICDIEQPLVSVVIPCYNHENFVQDSIQSVIDQTYKNIELIIIDDGSRDHSATKIQEMVESCDKRFVRFEFRSRANIGLSATLNEALEWCEGKYYSAIASDDQMLSNKTTIQVNFLQNNLEYVAVFGGIQLLDENSNVIEKLVNKAGSYSFEDIMMHRHDLPAPTQMLRLDLVRKVNGYDPSISIEDWYMWLKLSEINNIYYMDKFLANYRKHENNFSKNIIEMQNEKLKVLKCFSYSPYYYEAEKHIRWVNALEDLITHRNSCISNFIKVFFIDHKRTEKMIIEKIYKKLRFRNE